MKIVFVLMLVALMSGCTTFGNSGSNMTADQMRTKGKQQSEKGENIVTA